MLNSDLLKQRQRYQQLIDDSADRIAKEFAARASDGMPLTSDGAVNWLKRELAGFGIALGRAS